MSLVHDLLCRVSDSPGRAVYIPGFSRLLQAVSNVSLLDGSYILFLTPNSEMQILYLVISHKAKVLCNLEVLNTDSLFMCEQINSPEICCLECRVHSLPLQLCGVWMRSFLPQSQFCLQACCCKDPSLEEEGKLCTEG